MIFRTILFIACNLVSLSILAQYTLNHDAYIDPLSIDSLQSRVEDLKEMFINKSKGNDLKSHQTKVIKEIKEMSDYLYFKNMWDLYKIDTSSENRINLLSQLMFYKYSTIKNKLLEKNARIIYEESRKALIYEYQGNVELLETIEVNAAYQAVIYPFLKRAIIAAGGKWKRGEIPDLFIPQLIKKQ